MRENIKIPKLRFPNFNEQWTEETFENLLLSSRLGGNYSNSETVNDNPLIKMGNLNRGNIKLDRLEYISENEIVNDKDLIKQGDLFFNTRNTLELVGKVAIWRNELSRAFYNSNLMYIKFSNNYFMNYRLNSFQAIKALKRLATGTTSVAAIYNKDLKLLKFNTPEQEEQQKIASFLNAVDEKLNLLQKKKEGLEQYKKGVMQQLFSQKLRFKKEDGSDFPDWEEKKLGQIAHKQSSNISANTIEENAGNYKIYGASGLLKHIDFYRENEPFISIVKDGAGVGRTLLCDAFSSVLGTLDIIKPKINSNLYFIYSLLNNIDFTKYITGSTIPHIYFKDYSKEIIGIPSLEEQSRIADFLINFDKKLDLIDAQLNNMQQFKKGLLQQMFV